ncbi:MAG: hypothetical protein WDM88_08265 [Galbitalea sp.]
MSIPSPPKSWADIYIYVGWLHPVQEWLHSIFSWWPITTSSTSRPMRCAS